MYLDDPIDVYSSHTMLHDAVAFNRTDLFDFLISSGANLNLRDQNGYTPLLKAASIGRKDMCQKLIDNGVDPRQMDPFGNSPLDKAKLYHNVEVIALLQRELEDIERNERAFVDWKDPERINRSGKWRSFLHY